jgi:Lon-like protease
MSPTMINLPGLTADFKLVRLKLDVTWIVSGPLVTIFIARIYIPLIDSSLSPLEYWLTSIGIAALILVSLATHIFAHAAAARVLGNLVPEGVPLFLLADSAQVWPAGRTAGRDALSALAGPAANLVLAGIAYTIWNLQISSYFNLISLFLALFNLVLAVINLSPGFPLDGGRLIRSIAWSLFKSPSIGTRLARWFGFSLAAFLAVWGLVLVAAQARLVFAAAAIALAQSFLVLISLVLGGRGPEPGLSKGSQQGFKNPAKWVLTIVLMMPMLALFASLLPLNLGLKAPGTTASVEPMVQIPTQFVFQSKGKLILTSVIPQAPILLAEWVYAHLDTSIEIVPEEEIVPPHQTIQSQAEEGHRTLATSESTAAAVGLRLAGYEVSEISKGIVIDTISPGSPASSVLEIGDLITGLNGQNLRSADDLRKFLRTQAEGTVLSLEIAREGRSMVVKVPTLPPAEPGGAVRIGINVHTDIAGFNFPFPVEITPQKIVGGPSAGLMFTLAVYDLVTPGDLTGGHAVAGTGTIDLDGNVGPIGGVEQKVVAAERAGAKYFLAPAENYQDALGAAGNIQVIKVTSAQNAIDFLETLTPG